MATKCVADLQPGTRVDLEGDAFADARKDAGGNSEHPEFEFEFETVLRTIRETPDCIVIEFESGFTCGFPTDHKIKIDTEQ